MQNNYFVELLSMVACDNIVEEKRILYVLFLKIKSLWNVYVNQIPPWKTIKNNGWCLFSAAKQREREKKISFSFIGQPAFTCYLILNFAGILDPPQLCKEAATIDIGVVLVLLLLTLNM